ncbi:hypothetical protein, partial [Nonomuraea sp. NPDC003201]
AEQRPFGYEGAAAACTVLDLLTLNRRHAARPHARSARPDAPPRKALNLSSRLRTPRSSGLSFTAAHGEPHAPTSVSACHGRS